MKNINDRKHHFRINNFRTKEWLGPTWGNGFGGVFICTQAGPDQYYYERKSI